MAEKITMGADGLRVPDHPILPFIEGDGIGPDIWAAAVRVFDAAVEKAYAGSRQVDRLSQVTVRCRPPETWLLRIQLGSKRRSDTACAGRSYQGRRIGRRRAL